MIDFNNLQKAFVTYDTNVPYRHCVIDDFLNIDLAKNIENEFNDYNDPSWYFYNNQIENKKQLSTWGLFKEHTYKTLHYLNSCEFIHSLSLLTKIKLYSDFGLHGGGMHIHDNCGILNPHLDYNIHPKLKLQRKFNLLIYLSQNVKGGHLGLWSDNNGQPNELIKEIEPKFNRAVLMDTSQQCWHGISQPIVGLRKSLAIYYLTDPDNQVDNRFRAVFAPTKDQINDPEILKIIKDR